MLYDEISSHTTGLMVVLFCYKKTKKGVLKKMLYL